jgi:hypothetical protein
MGRYNRGREREPIAGEKEVLYLEDLKGPGQCQDCGTTLDGLAWFEAECHPEAGLDVAFHPDGFLQISCRECEACVMEVAVATRGVEPGLESVA